MPSAVSGNTFKADNAMTGFNGATLSYDANGNLSGDGTNTYTWDARNHLSAISGATTASFVYDAFGRRMSKTINNSGRQFLYDGWNPVQELQNGSPSANLLMGLNIDEYFSRTDSSGTMALLADALGSTIGLTNSSGSLATTYTYEPFGVTTVGGTANANPYQFTGRENDGLGLYFYRARFYSPAMERFISQDESDLVATAPNLYSYAQDDPIDFEDPLGLCPHPPKLPKDFTPPPHPPRRPFWPIKPLPPPPPGKHWGLTPHTPPTPPSSWPPYFPGPHYPKTAGSFAPG